MANKKISTPKFDAAVVAAHDKYFLDCETQEEYMNATMAYYQSKLNLMRMGLPAVQSELNHVTLRFKNASTDDDYGRWAATLKSLLIKHKCIKVSYDDFNAIEYLAITWIAGNRGTNKWVSLFKAAEA